MPPLRALLGGCGHKELAVGIGQHESAYVPAVQHDVVSARKLPLQFHHLVAHDGQRGNVGRRFRHMRRAQVRRDVFAVDVYLLRSALVAYVHIEVGQHFRHGGFVFHVRSAFQHEISDASVHRARVEINYAELPRDGLRYRALSRSRGTVYCNVYHKCSLRNYSLRPFLCQTEPLRFDVMSAAAAAAVEKAICKLYPPVYASASITSPMK